MKTDDKVIEAINELPDSQRTFYPSPVNSVTFREMPFSTNDLKALTNELLELRAEVGKMRDLLDRWMAATDFPAALKDTKEADDEKGS